MGPEEEPGEYEVCLIAYASETCTDTACHTIVVQGSGYWVPNTFTPDGNGLNDFFFPVLGNPDPEEFRFMIFDRWGQPLFSTENPAVHWDGNFSNGTEVPIGVYVWKLWLREPFTTDRVERTGRSSRLGCPQEDPSSPGGFSITPAEWPACLASVKAQWGPRLNGFTTTDAARDLDR